MAVPTIKPQQVVTGPGQLKAAPLGSTLPTVAVASGKFSHTWDLAWIDIGATSEGTEESHSITVDAVEVAESYYPVKRVTTGKADSLSFAMAQINAFNWRLALNAAAAAVTLTGTGATALQRVRPPLAGSEVRYMLAWVSDDDTQLLMCYQVFQTGNVTIPRRKGADKAVLSVEFGLELPDSAIAPVPYDVYLAGPNYM